MMEAQAKHTIAWMISLVFTVGAVFVSIHLIYLHHLYFHKPRIQRPIIGILWMVPIYAVDSWISLRFPAASLYMDLVRDVYEAYVIYLFLTLLIAYLGEGDDARVLRVLEQQPPIKHMSPCCCLKPHPANATFLRRCKAACLQFVIIKPLCTVLALALEANDLLDEGHFRVDRGYAYLAAVMNVSITVAFYWLAMFYFSLKKPLAPHSPVPKFLCIKAVLFMTFWQSVLIAGLVHVGFIHDVGAFTAESISRGLQNFLITLEMFIAACAHRWAFSHEPFAKLGKRATSLLAHNFATDELARDLNEVSPIAVPTRFQPRARVVRRADDPGKAARQPPPPATAATPNTAAAAERGWSVL